MPRLGKLISIQRFKNILKSFEKENADEGTLLRQYQTLFYYKVFRLLLIAFNATYFLGCFWYYISISQKNWAVKDVKGTWYEQFDLGPDSDMITSDQIVTSLYFALTTLSTVGYGDLFPVSQIERIFAVIVMLLGVAFFSFIMGNIMTIVEDQKVKMGILDKKSDLAYFLINV